MGFYANAYVNDCVNIIVKVFATTIFMKDKSASGKQLSNLTKA